MAAEDQFTIARVRGLLALDSRGNPTVKAVVETKGGSRGWALSPSGASKGAREAVELRDGGSRWGGKGVGLALAKLNEVVAPRLVGLDSRMQAAVDRLLLALDGTQNKSRIGGNVTTAVSLATARAAAAESGLELFEYLGGPGARFLPVPLLNVINGGVHAGNELDFQEFMLVPVGFDSIAEALRASVEVYKVLRGMLKDRYGASAVNVGDEGGFAPPMRSAEEALEALSKAIRGAGYELGPDFYLGIDAAASQLKEGDGYRVEGRLLDRGALTELYVDLASRYPLVYLEDPFAEDDPDGFSVVTRRLKGRTIVVGDDLFVTRADLVLEGAEKGLATGVLIKVNQVGTLTEALETITAARDHGMAYIISHRSGDTEDPFIADLAVATSAIMIKTGAPARSERTAKYNRLLEIEAILSGSARYSASRLKGIVKPL